MADGGVKRTFAEKLDHLLLTVHPKGRKPYSMDEVAAAIAAKGYEHVSAGYIWALRRGERDNPTIKTVEALADFFGVPPGYFLDNDEELVQRVDSQLGLLTKMRDAGIENLAMRAAELSPDSREAVARLIDAMAHMIDTVATKEAPPPEGGSVGPG